MFYIFFISLLFNVLHAGDIHIIYLEDAATQYKCTIQVVNRYNLTALQKIKLTHYTDGDQLTLDTLHEAHAVWSDIQMPRENGDMTLARILKEACIRAKIEVPQDATMAHLKELIDKSFNETGIRIPPFVATTTLTSYYNKGSELSAFAQEKGFIFGRDKIKTTDHITEVFEAIAVLLGEHWLETHAGIIPADNTLVLESINSDSENEEELDKKPKVVVRFKSSTINGQIMPVETKADEENQPMFTLSNTPISSISTLATGNGGKKAESKCSVSYWRDLLLQKLHLIT